MERIGLGNGTCRSHRAHHAGISLLEGRAVSAMIFQQVRKETMLAFRRQFKKVSRAEYIAETLVFIIFNAREDNFTKNEMNLAYNLLSELLLLC